VQCCKCIGFVIGSYTPPSSFFFLQMHCKRTGTLAPNVMHKRLQRSLRHSPLRLALAVTLADR